MPTAPSSTTVGPATGPATPTVFWACAAIGAPMVVKTAAMANRWFRMFCSFA
jgi:hypothetical protein